MKRIITASALITVVLLAGCERSPQKGSKADGAGSDQLTHTELGVAPEESEDWGYLGLKILKVHEQQKALDQAPWHEPGGDWTFLECAADKDASVRVVIGSRVRSTAKANIPMTWGEAFLAVSDPSAGAAFVQAFAKAFHQPLPPRQGEKPPGFLKAGAAVLGANLVRDPKGGFSVGRKGTWTTTKWFLQSEAAEAEVYFNWSAATGQAEFCEKDEEYREELLEQFVVGLRDGPLPERTPENDPTLTLVGPRVVGWTQVAGTNESAQFTPRGDGLVITATTSRQGAKLFLAPIAQPQERQALGEFEGSVLVHEVLYRGRGPALFLAEMIRRDLKVLSSTDPQRLWLADTQGKLRCSPRGLTNWVVGKGGISPDGRFVALHSWHKQGKQQGTRVVHIGDVQKGGWRTVELASTSLELVGWEGEKPKGVALTGDRYNKGAVQKAYALDPRPASSRRLKPCRRSSILKSCFPLSSPHSRGAGEAGAGDRGCGRRPSAGIDLLPD